MTKLKAFSKLYFGESAAEEEVLRDSRRFVETYLDHWRVKQQVEAKEKFLLLGPRGSGKSAAAEYLVQRWKMDHGVSRIFPTLIYLDDLYAHEMGPGRDSSITELSASWEVFLGIHFLQTLWNDQGSSLHGDPQIERMIYALSSHGLIGSTFSELSRKVRDESFSLSLPSVANYSIKWTEREQLSLRQAGGRILDVVLASSSASRHILLIDGLDRVITTDPQYWSRVSSLMQTAQRLYQRIRRAEAEHLYLLVMCRSDVFRKAPFADASKISTDLSIHLGWYTESPDPGESLLWDYIASKARLTFDELSRYLPAKVNVSNRAVETKRWLLQMTRHTPRDMTNIFREVQTLTIPGRIKPEPRSFRQAANPYGSHYFLNEIASESVGMLPEVVVRHLERVVRGLGSRIFSRGDLQRSLEALPDFDPRWVAEVGEYLYLQGAIGLYSSRTEYVNFYHRRDTVAFDPTREFIVHNALAYTFNLPWGRQS